MSAALAPVRQPRTINYQLPFPFSWTVVDNADTGFPKTVYNGRAPKVSERQHEAANDGEGGDGRDGGNCSEGSYCLACCASLQAFSVPSGPPC
jgi:hypothetical protein